LAPESEPTEIHLHVSEKKQEKLNLTLHGGVERLNFNNIRDEMQVGFVRRLRLINWTPFAQRLLF
jgi:hypothetical protein